MSTCETHVWTLNQLITQVKNVTPLIATMLSNQRSKQWEWQLKIIQIVNQLTSVKVWVGKN